MTEKSFKHIADNLDPEVKWVKPVIVVHPYIDNQRLQVMSDAYLALNRNDNHIEHAKTALIIAINKSEESNLLKEIKPTFKVVPGSHYRDIKIEKIEKPNQESWVKKHLLRPIILFAVLVFFFVLAFPNQVF